MVDQLSPANTCRLCGASLNPDRASVETPDGLCDLCIQNRVGFWPQTDAQAASVPYPYYQNVATAQPTLDPDRPWWGVLVSIGMWLFSTATIIVIPAIAVVAWIFLDRARGIELPPNVTQDNIPPNLLLVGIYSTLLAHLVTLAFFWAVVTRFKKEPFLKSLGWNWAGRSGLYWLMVSFGIFVLLIGADFIFPKFLPQRETDFDRILKVSQQIRIAIAITAVLTAPFIEELIYRGVLYSGLRKRMGTVATVITVTILFAGVHLPQYWGAWATMAGLTLLSLILTIVRAKTKSILPSVLIHFVNNAIASVFILLQAGQQSVQPEGLVCKVIGRAVWMLFVKF
ncbi:MAG: type II CAAX endopeptidase family protein [Blastocatellia bacterium]